jgi:fluoride exporter
MWRSLLAVAIGATFGAWLRWGLGAWLNPIAPQLPVGTLIANLFGGYLIGVAVGWFGAHPQLALEWRLLIVTGFLGALTTFSTFSAESVGLLQRGAVGAALLHSGAHLFGSLLMTALGLWSVRAVQSLAE